MLNDKCGLLRIQNKALDNLAGIDTLFRIEETIQNVSLTKVG